ncbi:MAG: sensor histidine kinase [Actinomycetota bacterium]
MAEELSGRAEDRFDSVDEVLAFFVHELRNPLAVIKGYASALEDADDLDPALVTAGAAAIRRGVRTMDSLISSLGSAAALFGGEIDLDLEDVLASGLVEETVADLGAIADGHRLIVSVEDDAVIRVDNVKIRQVLMNLISNSLKFSPPGTSVDIKLSRQGEDIEICVIDEGPGIPAERLDELFRKFSRLGSSKTGTGLGLFISRAIARAHRGDLSLGDATDGGCHFIVTLPIHEPAARGD